MERWDNIDAMFTRSDEQIHKIYDKFLQLARVTIEPDADRITQSKGQNNEVSPRANHEPTHELGGDPHLAAAALRSKPLSLPWDG